MSVALLTFGLVLQAAVVGVWLYQHIAINRIYRDGLIVQPFAAATDLPHVTIIVPARNESDRVGECVESILTQSHRNLRLIIVDDRSEDNTGFVARRAAGDDSRLTVQRIESLPPGWMGKSHALWSATRLATSDWLLFLDADCRLLPGGLAAALAYAHRRKLDMLSLWPRDASVGFWERLLIPLAGAMIAIWYGSPRVNQPNAPEAFANGQFILIKRSAYRTIGGHEAVRDAIIEDIPLARRVKNAGYSTCAALGASVCAVRMYGSLGEIYRGWRRIYAGVLSRRQIALSVASIVFGSLAPYIIFPVALAWWIQSTNPWAASWLVASSAHLAALMATSVRFFGLARCRLRYLWIYPLSCVGVIAILCSAFLCLTSRRVEVWRGTEYVVENATVQKP